MLGVVFVVVAVVRHQAGAATAAADATVVAGAATADAPVVEEGCRRSEMEESESAAANLRDDHG